MVSQEMSTPSVSDTSSKTPVLSRPVLRTFTMKGIGKQGIKYSQDRLPLSGKQHSCVFWPNALLNAESDVLPCTSMVLAAEAFWKPDHTLSDVTSWGWWSWRRGLDSSAPRPSQQSSDLHLHSLRAVSEKPSCPLNLSAASQILSSQLLWEKKAGEGCPEALTWNSVALRCYLFGFYFVLFEVGPFPDWPPAYNPPPFQASQMLGLQAWTIAPSPTFSLYTNLVLLWKRIFI